VGESCQDVAAVRKHKGKEGGEEERNFAA